jgi:hypothetical protein
MFIHLIAPLSYSHPSLFCDILNTGGVIMSVIQKRILLGLAMVTALVCLFAFATIRVTFFESTPKPTPTQTPIPSATATETPEPTETPRPDVGDDIGAIVICEKFVKEQLIAPREAKFPGIFDEQPTATQMNSTAWHVEGWVDAANRMGVHVRLDYTCEVQYLGDDRWRLDALDIQEP